jgi:hypothetical protein
MGLSVGSVSVSTSHRAGMSSLWHDPDFILPDKRLEIPLVVRTFDDLPVPTEHHELPPGVEDPFAKLDAMYDVAGQQMERGIRGAQFLHGKTPDREASGTTARPASTQHGRVHKPEVLVEQQRERAQTRDIDKASKQPLRAPQASKTSADDDVGSDVAAAMVPVAGAQAVTAAIHGPLPTLAAQAVAAVNVAAAVTSTAQLVGVGLTDAPSPTSNADAPSIRRGLRG